ncbi:MAG: dockerin type I repeat-containing protein [Ruminococcus sp.]|nr:dockerin type I repeat-containing protein [Ruminococcus sp.]
MKKKLLALALGITTALSAVPLMSAKALAPPIPGDVNLDWTINIADLVCMQKYLMGTGTINTSQFGLTTVDLNNDGRVDVFDYIELRRLVDEWCGLSKNDVKIESRFTQVDTSIPPGVHYSRPSGSACIIRSVEDLEYYLSPYNVITHDGNRVGGCVFIEAACQEVLDDLYARYDDEFFANNILLLNYLSGTAGYEFESIQYEDEKLVIKYYDSTPYGLTWCFPLPPYIAEVAVPKTLWADGDYTWERVEQPVEITVTSDFTNEITNSAITSSYSKPSVIKNSEELDTYLDGKFHSGVKMSLKETYNDEFFADNVLVIDLYYQKYRDDYVTSVSTKKDEYNNLVFHYDRQFINGFVDEGIQINQVTIPKEQYHFTDTFKEKAWETSVDVSYASCDLFSIAEMNGFELNDETIKCYSKEGAWVNSDVEMRAYLSECMSDEMVEFLFPESSDGLEKPALYNPDSPIWNRYSIYMWVDNNIIGATHSLINSAETDDKLNITLSNVQPLSCMGGSFLHIIRTSKTQSGKAVSINNINMNDCMPHTDGESAILQFGKDVVMLNQYTFGNKNVADIYRLYLGGGPVQYSGYDYIGTVELDEGYQLVKKGDYVSYGAGEKVIMESGEYAITIENEQLTISYKYSADSEYTEKTFNY